MNLHEQVKDTPQWINTRIQENMMRHYQSMAQHKYMTQMDNAIIDEDTGKESKYRQ